MKGDHETAHWICNIYSCNVNQIQTVPMKLHFTSIKN